MKDKCEPGWLEAIRVRVFLELEYSEKLKIDSRGLRVTYKAPIIFSTFKINFWKKMFLIYIVTAWHSTLNLAWQECSFIVGKTIKNHEEKMSIVPVSVYIDEPIIFIKVCLSECTNVWSIKLQYE